MKSTWSLALLVLCGLAALPLTAEAATNLPMVCTDASQAGTAVNVGCGGRAMSGQVFRTPRDTDLVRVRTDGAKVADWESSTYAWKAWAQVKPGEFYDTCTADVAEGSPVPGSSCAAYGMIARAVVLEKPPGSTAVMTWIPPTKDTNGENLTGLQGFRIYRGATWAGRAVVGTVGPAVTTWESPQLTAGTHVLGVSAFTAQAESEVAGPVNVTVASIAKPTLSLAVTPTDGVANVTPTLTWSSTNATACTASGAWSGAKPVTGTALQSAVVKSASYTLTCTGPGGSVAVSAAVSVSPRPAAPSGVSVILK